MKIIDTHAHLYLKEFNKDLDKVVCQSKEHLDYILLPNIDMSSIADMHRLCDVYPNFCFPMIGLHPCSVKADFEKVLFQMEELLQQESYVGIGETGLDLHWDKSTLKIQQESLKIHLDWAKKNQLPVVLHCRDSFNETIELVENAQNGSLTGVFHCFGGNLEEAKRVTDVGFYLGIGGIITYKNCSVSNVLPHIDPNKIVLETDCPYLPPIPNRGKRNEPAFISHTAQKTAESLGISLQALVNLTHINTLRLFPKIQQSVNPN